jgi:hypothetical protein
MTRLSPPIIHKCPSCAGNFTRHTLTSLHFYDDAPDWSDGKSGQWWAGSTGCVGRCPVCSKIVWIEDADEVMRLPWKPCAIGAVTRLWHRVTGDRRGLLRELREWNTLPREVQEAQSLGRLISASDFIQALAELPQDAKGREVHLRHRLWWACNDHLGAREGEGRGEMRSAVDQDAARANALRLLVLLEYDPKGQVQRGELLRQLGRFDEAVAVLKAVKPDGYSEVRAVKIEQLALARVAELQDLKAAPVRQSTREGATDLPKFGGVVW